MAASMDALVDRVLKEFNNLTSKPESFLSVQDVSSQKFTKVTKELYDTGNRHCPIKGLSGALPELYTDGFDDEQVWQQLELHNESAFRILMKNTAKLLSAKGNKLSFKQVDHSDRAKEEEETEPMDDGEVEEKDDDGSVASDLSFQIPADSDDEDEDESDEDDFDDLKFDEYKVLEDESEEKGKKSKNQLPSYKKTEVDDQFFKLREMEDFLQKEEGKKGDGEDNDEEDGIDLFDEIPSEDDGQDEAIKAKYKDFFRGSIPPGNRKRLNEEGQEGDEEEEEEEENEDDEDETEPREKRVKFNFDDDEPSDEDEESFSEDDGQPNSDVKSSYELRQERLRAKIKDLEDEAVAPKPWQLLGETKAELRPENALLEEDLFFDHTTRTAPVITEETTRTLEDIIRQRVKDQAFDDVERKIKPVYDPSEYKKKLVLDQEKSKFSLAEIYEQEYLKQQENQEQGAKASSLADPIGEKASDNKAQIRIRKMMDDVFTKLDALCNFHYTPRTPAPEVKIVSNMPSIAMEEIAPVTVSDANLLAPEEVQDHVRGELKSSTEKEKTDRLRDRRQKKSAQRLKHKERERAEKAVSKANPGLGNKHARNRALENLQKAEKEGTVSLIKDSGRQKAPKSSTAFFNQLQEEVSAGVDAARKSKQQKTAKKRATGSQLKL
uniref:U3 small nucleolar ribonucleoprotein protein MPP10 n=1 Tax=Alona affinis TaxID=381656 RepID=A0A9N6ZEV6_9CRUS|nr:EOG090X09DZ [Alona affinis]